MENLPLIGLGILVGAALAVLWRTHQEAPGKAIATSDDLRDLAERMTKLEGEYAGLRLEWSNSHMQITRLVKRLARYAGDPPAEPAPAPAPAQRRTLSLAEVMAPKKGGE